MRRAWSTGTAWLGVATLTVAAFAAPPREDIGDEIPVPENVGPIRSFFRTLAPKMTKQPTPEIDSEAPRKPTGFWKDRPSSTNAYSGPTSGNALPKNATAKPSASSKTGALHSYSIPSLPRVITPSRSAISAQELDRLATQACACHPEAKRALIAALTSSKEDLRYEAIQAVLDHVNHRCQRCDRALCRDDVIASIVADMAYGRDSSGQSLERSELVRGAARDVVRAAHKTRADSPSRSTANAFLRDPVEDDYTPSRSQPSGPSSAPRTGVAQADEEPARSLPATSSATRLAPFKPSASSTIPQAPDSGPRFIQASPSQPSNKQSSRTGIGFANTSPPPEEDPSESRSLAPSATREPVMFRPGNDPAQSESEPPAPAPRYEEPARPAPRQPALKTTKSTQPFANRIAPPVSTPAEAPVEPNINPPTATLGPNIESPVTDELPSVQRLTPDGRPTSRRVNPTTEAPPTLSEPLAPNLPNTSTPAPSLSAPDESTAPVIAPVEADNPYSPSARRKNTNTGTPARVEDTPSVAPQATVAPVLAPQIESPVPPVPTKQVPPTLSPRETEPQLTPSASTTPPSAKTPAPASAPAAAEEPTPELAPAPKNLGEPTLAPPINRSSKAKFGTPTPATQSTLPTSQKGPAKAPAGATVWVKG